MKNTVPFLTAFSLMFSFGFSSDAFQHDGSDTTTSSNEGPGKANSSLKFDVSDKVDSALPESAILVSVGSVLINADGETVAASNVSKAPYLLFYYSAHWCPPCRLFTPKLVEFYNSNGGGEKFEIIFVSSDRSEDAMIGYMKEENMPWAAVKYDAISSTGIKDHGGAYIPSLVMFDNKGNLVISTDYDNGIEPSNVLEKLMDSI